MTDVVAELGHLKKLAEQDANKRFSRLYRLLEQGGLLAIAKERIAGNKGAQTPGVDGQTMADVGNEQIVQLSEELRTRTYQPKPVRRAYIPKRNGKLRPLGIPTSRDKIVQAGVALILETLYEPLFCKCSHGFRAGHSTITALKQVWNAYYAGAKWIIEGDITDCFGSIPHGVILNCLRKRIKDERFIDLIRKMLQAGAMEAGSLIPSYSGTPQGGVASPILANIVLHELDVWLETQMGVNPPPQTAGEIKARKNPEYIHLGSRIARIREYLDGKYPMPGKYTPEGLRQELREKLRLRSRQPSLLPRKVTYYTRYADDFVVMLCNASKTEANRMKAAISEWMQTNLGLTLNQDKTHVTHWRDKIRFLGYELEGRPDPNGVGWLHLGIPKEAVRNVVAKIQQATRYPQAPEYDVFKNVNAIARGWTNYYRYAHNHSATGSKVTTIVFWRTAHYLGKRQRCSIAKIMKSHYARNPKTDCLGLYTFIPGNPQMPKNRYFVWHKTPTRLQLGSNLIYQIEDRQAYIETEWAGGHSQHTRIETRVKAGMQCEHCGISGVQLYVHHPNRLVNAKRVKKGMAHVAQSGLEQKTILLCQNCHLSYHHAKS